LAYQKLIAEAVSNQNKSLKNDALVKSFQSFMSLDDNDRKNLVHNIEILNAALDIFDIPVEIQSRFFTSVRREHRAALYGSLEGWWLDKMINHLGKLTSDELIPRYEVEDKIVDLAEQFQPDALPTDFFTAPLEIPGDAEERLFVFQLKGIEVSSQRTSHLTVDQKRS